jgi:tetratricopeptide (TPR) repeat protein
MRRTDAAAWYSRGQDEARAGRIEPALTALRRATVRDPSNRRYRIALANALQAGHHEADARKVLEGLRELQPDDADTNLELARLEASEGDVVAARRYYLSALSAVWRPEEARARASIRLELIELLLAHGERDRALAELLNITVGLPDDPKMEARVGRMFLEAGDPSQALNRFSRALQVDPHDGDALAGAGEAAFALRDYTAARRYLSQAPRTEQVVRLQTVVDQVLSADPLGRGLSAVDRGQRLSAAYQQAMTTLAACAARQPETPAGIAGTLADLASEARGFEPVIREGRPSRDIAESVVDLILRIEQNVALACGTQSPFDQALLLIGQRHQE